MDRGAIECEIDAASLSPGYYRRTGSCTKIRQVAFARELRSTGQWTGHGVVDVGCERVVFGSQWCWVAHFHVRERGGREEENREERSNHGRHFESKFRPAEEIFVWYLVAVEL